MTSAAPRTRRLASNRRRIDANRRRGLVLQTAVLAFALVSGIVGVLPGRSGSAGADVAPPAIGWRQLTRTVDRGGIEIIRLARDEPATRARVAIIPRSQIGRLRTVLASPQLVGGSGRDLTTSLCARVHCHAAINGDRWDLSGHDAGRRHRRAWPSTASCSPPNRSRRPTPTPTSSSAALVRCTAPSSTRSRSHRRSPAAA